VAETLLTVARVARLVGAPLDAVRRWVESGRLPSAAAPDGGGRLVRRSDLEAFVAANEMPPLPPEGAPDLVDQFLAALPVHLRGLMAAALRREWPGA
jgi:excisionase family DNA binding protein